MPACRFGSRFFQAFIGVGVEEFQFFAYRPGGFFQRFHAGIDHFLLEQRIVVDDVDDFLGVQRQLDLAGTQFRDDPWLVFF
jgi:hypothetical protein